MLWALLHHLSHDVVKVRDLLDIALELLESHEVPDLDIVSN
jgi:hypothetical protein